MGKNLNCAWKPMGLGDEEVWVEDPDEDPELPIEIEEEIENETVKEDDTPKAI